MTGKHSAIVLFVRGLPASVSRNELRAHFQARIRSGWMARLSGQGAVCACDIIRITDRDTRRVEYHGLVEIQPAKVAMQAIRELSGTSLHGHVIEVRRYRHRSPLREPLRGEEMAVQVQGTDGIEYVQERRRQGLTIELVTRSGTDLIPSMTRMFQPRRALEGYEG